MGLLRDVVFFYSTAVFLSFFPHSINQLNILYIDQKAEQEVKERQAYPLKIMTED